MAYDEDLATRIRDLIGPDPDLTEKKMFGGLAFLIRGHMAISASGQGGVLVHVDPGRSGDLMATTRATTAVMQGREMPGWLRVSPEDLASDDDLSGWVEIGIGHARSLPPQAAREEEAEEVSDAMRDLPRAADRCRSQRARSRSRQASATGREHGGTYQMGHTGRAGLGRRNRRPGRCREPGGPGTGHAGPCRMAAGLVTLALAARDQRLRNRPAAALS